MTYDPQNRLDTLVHKNSANEILASYDYSVAPNGRRTGVVEQRREDSGTYTNTNIVFGYDAMDRLVSETASSTAPELTHSAVYTYDLAGNRLEKRTGADIISYAYNANDQLLEEDSDVDGVTSFGFDTNGSLTTKTKTSGETNVFTYSLDNRLAHADISREEEGRQVAIAADYTYNQGGIRVQAATSTSVDGGLPQNDTRVFLVDGNNHTGYAQVIEEAGEAGTTPDRSYLVGDDILGQSTGVGTSYLLYDGHGSTRLLAGANGFISDRYDYDAYGNSLHSKPTALHPGATNLLYCGEQYDSDLQNYYLRARYYDPETGRFNRLDPFAGSNYDPQSLHKYAYANCDPVNEWDPSGEFSLTEVLVTSVIIGIVAGMLATVITGNVKTGILVGIVTALFVAAIMTIVTFWPQIVQSLGEITRLIKAFIKNEFKHLTISDSSYGDMLTIHGGPSEIFMRNLGCKLFKEVPQGWVQQFGKWLLHPINNWGAFSKWFTPTSGAINPIAILAVVFVAIILVLVTTWVTNKVLDRYYASQKEFRFDTIPLPDKRY
jgi:RHS repeat-associated protein